jgi:hypothetical protein
MRTFRVVKRMTQKQYHTFSIWKRTRINAFFNKFPDALALLVCIEAFEVSKIIIDSNSLCRVPSCNSEVNGIYGND